MRDRESILRRTAPSRGGSCTILFTRPIRQLDAHAADMCSCARKLRLELCFNLVLTRLETVFAAHRLCACETELSDLYALRETTLVGRLLLLSRITAMIFGRK